MILQEHTCRSHFLSVSIFFFVSYEISTFPDDSLTGGSIVGDMAPHQAFTIGGLGSVRGYGEGAVGSGRSCLVANSEFTVPLVCGNFLLRIGFESNLAIPF